jgi:maltooligosyltrehalose trehalohydrolase
MSGLIHRMPFGAEPADGGVRFRLWAPDAREVSLLLEGPRRRAEVPLDGAGDGWREAVVAEATAGTRYRFRIDGGLAVPDPASRFQPDDVHGASEVIDPLAFHWTCTEWRGRPWEETVVYELHVGTFTPKGTFGAMSEKLSYLVDLGVTAVEIMPVADFPGRRDWGYDGVALFAPDAVYGRPDDLKAFVDSAHRHGLMVMMDVVYNHFGPEGNYLHVYARRFFNDERHTPWGAAINFDAEGSEVVRRFFVENALYWVDEFAMDGLRFDAVHAIEDRSRPDILEEIADEVRSRLPNHRYVHLVLENDKNQARYLARADQGRPRHYVAQWNDDIHHAMHVLLTGEERGYYADYADDPARHLARCLTEGFAYQDDPSPFRAGERRGEVSRHLPATAFVSFLQNHDQIGNRAFGDRITTLAPPEAVHAGLALLLLAPSPPLVFMGEEWASTQPFLFFCDLGESLRDAVRDGRRKEFASFPEFAAPEALRRIPDPTAEATFLKSKLDWPAAERSPHREALAETRRLLTLRRQEIAPRLAGMSGHAGRIEWIEEASLSVAWRMGDGALLAVVANLAPTPARVADTPSLPAGDPLYSTAALPPTSGALDRLPPWTVMWFLERGDRTQAKP